MAGKILIVDDVAINRIILKVKLSAAYYQVIQAANGAEALEHAQQERPSLILLSDSLPDITGIELCRALRAQPAGTTVPLVMLSSDLSKPMRLRALHAGADDVLAKPPNEAFMLARVRSLMRARATADEMRLRDGTNRALGFTEDDSSSCDPAKVLLVSPAAGDMDKWKRSLEQENTGHNFAMATYRTVIPHLGYDPTPDVILTALDQYSAETGLRLLADLRSRPGTRNIPVMAIVSDVTDRAQRLASDALDLGASDLMRNGFDSSEALLRIETLVRRKRRADRLHANMRDGLMAALIDPLTGLFNRRYALPHLARMAASARATGQEFAVMLADLDHFKQVNDRYGHASGDAVLVAVSKLLRDNLRGMDLAARLGGEEFLIALPNTSHNEAERTAERLCRILRETPLSLPEHPTPTRITTSIGVAVCSGATGYGPDDIEALIQQADRALYRAKSRGRNQVTFSQRPAA